MEITQGRAYLFTNSGTGLKLHSPNDKGDKVLNQDSGPHAKKEHNYQWLLYPADTEGTWWWIVSRSCGFMVFAPGVGEVGEQIRQAGSPNLDNQRYKWKFEQVDGNHYKIKLMRSDKYVHAIAEGIGSHVNLDDGGGKQLEWLVEEAQVFDAVTSLRPAGEKPDFGEIDRMHDFKPPAESTKPVVVGSVALPFFVVGDEGQSVGWKVNHSPYYILSRSSSWVRKGYQEHDGNTDFSHTWETEVGLVSSNSSEIEKSLNIRVTAEAGFSYMGATAKISATIAAGLRVKESRTQTKTSTKKDIKTLAVKAGKRFSVAAWYRLDTFKLRRLDGDTILTWETIDPDSFVLDSYPKV
ncbi:hypothetical protein ABTZ03_31405 [Kitasatospora sp. NPDC096077]|uniref:hypothetical protein n=1 Tax=Kitasatospora sp. NPDC096077 TaxID=3155544 RepID=UPI00331B09A2